jgi:multidrug resistance protein
MWIESVLSAAAPRESALQEASGNEDQRNRGTLIVVFVTILIDFIGFSVLIPVLPLFADRLGASPFQVGAILSSYALSQLLFLPAWGWVSDRLGRRPVILVSLFGTAVSFVLLATAGSIATIYLARVLGGFFAASIGTAQAVVTDVTPPAERASGMGVIGAAFGAGMVVGPMLGGSLAAINEQAPFVAVAALAAANGLLAWRVLPESRPTDLARPPWRDLARTLVPTPIRLLLQVHDRRIAVYLLLFFVFFTAFAVLESMVTLFLGKRFGADALDAALIFAWIGVFLVVTQGILLRRLVDLAGEVPLLITGLALMSASITAVAFVPAYGWFFLIGPLIAIGNGLAFPSFTSLYTKACRAEEAGELLGQSNSMATAGRIAGATGGGALMSADALGAPFVVAGAVMAGGLLLFLALRPMLLRSS